MAAACIAALVASTSGAGAASSPVTVSVAVPTATNLSVTSCASGTANVTDFGTMLPGATAVTGADCVVTFGSSNETAMLQASQRDGAGVAMYRPTFGVNDPSFDGNSGTGNGVVSTAIGTAADEYYDAVRQTDGKIVAVGYANSGSDVWLVARYDANGVLDPAFDGDSGTGNGLVTTAVGGASRARAVLLQPDGKIVAIGYRGGGTEYCAVRYLTTGQLDPNFDGDSGSGNGIVCVNISASWDEVFDAVLQPDGKIVMTGYMSIAAGNLDFATVRLMPDGKLDTSFDGDSGTGNGIVTTNINTGDTAQAIALEPDGQILIGGYSWGFTQFSLIRLNPNGTLDTAFDGDSGTGNGKVEVTGNLEWIDDLAVLDDGRILAVGVGGTPTRDFALVQYQSDGRLDTSFDGDSGTGNGKVFVPVGAAEDRPLSVVMEGDGSFLVAGWALNGTRDTAVIKVRPNGTLDTAFDGPSGTANGKIITNHATGVDDAINGALLLPDGELLQVGYTNNAGNVDALLVNYEGLGIADFASGTTDWSAGANMFGVCLHTVTNASGGAGVGGWTVAGTGNCTSALAANWRGVPTGWSKVAATTVSGTTNGTAALRFGIRLANTQQSGTYIAPISFQVVAPNV